MDLMLYIMNSECISVASSGSNLYFKPENAPGDVPLRCTDGCPFAENCQYNAVKLYTEGEGRYFVHKFECGESNEDIIRALESNPYGRCVYRCDNNVCDHQVANLEFANGATAVFTVSAFSLENTRTIKIMGTEGEIGGCMETGEITLKRFKGNTVEDFVVHHDGTKHCGGDSGLINYFTELVNSETFENDMNIFKAHILAFAAEKSRKNRMTVTF